MAKTKKKKTVKKKVSKKKTVKKKVLKKKETTKKVKPKKSPPRKKGKLSLRGKKILSIKSELLSQRDALLKEAEEALNMLPGGELNFPDMGDQATAETDRDFMLRLRGRERRLLKKIEDAVERIESGSYGICDGCGNEIGLKRLRARPVTALCIDCKTQQEEDERIAEGG